MYYKILKNSLKKEFMYNWATFFNIATSLITIILLRSFWRVLYKDDLSQYSYMANYTTISILVSTLLTLSSPNEMSNKIRDGGISIEMIRPWNYLVSLMFEDIGVIFSKVLTVIIPIIILSVVFFQLFVPQALVILLFLVSIMFSFIILFLVSNIVSMICFWVTEAWSMLILLNVVIQFFSGQFLPSWIMPKAIENIMNSLPFIWISQKPVELYIAQIKGSGFMFSQYLSCFKVQFIWIIILLIITTSMWKIASRKLAVQGG